MAGFDIRDCFSSSAKDYADSASRHSSLLPENASKFFLTGSLPLSSFLHIALKHLRHGPDASRSCLVLCKDVTELRQSLVAENDTALSGDNLVLDAVKDLQRGLDIIELKSVAHLRFFLASMRCDELQLPAEAHEDKLARSAYLSARPTMVILHSPSDWVHESNESDSSIETYASILALFHSQFAYIAPDATLIVFDKAANRFDLPVISRSKDENKSQGQEDQMLSLAKAGLYSADFLIDSQRVVGESPYAAGREPHVDHSIITSPSPWCRRFKGTPARELVFRKTMHFDATPESCTFEIVSCRIAS